MLSPDEIRKIAARKVNKAAKTHARAEVLVAKADRLRQEAACLSDMATWMEKAAAEQE